MWTPGSAARPHPKAASSIAPRKPLQSALHPPALHPPGFPCGKGAMCKMQHTRVHPRVARARRARKPVSVESRGARPGAGASLPAHGDHASRALADGRGGAARLREARRGFARGPQHPSARWRSHRRHDDLEPRRVPRWGRSHRGWLHRPCVAGRQRDLGRRGGRPGLLLAVREGNRPHARQRGRRVGRDARGDHGWPPRCVRPERRRLRLGVRLLGRRRGDAERDQARSAGWGSVGDGRLVSRLHGGPDRRIRQRVLGRSIRGRRGRRSPRRPGHRRRRDRHRQRARRARGDRRSRRHSVRHGREQRSSVGIDGPTEG